MNPKIVEHLQRQARDQNDADLNIFDSKLDTKRHLMSKEKGFFVQHRREYYNDFEDCLRDYKNAKIKSIQKQTKVHLSDGDHDDSDLEYVDCSDANELKRQESSKSMPHVPLGNYEKSICQSLEVTATAKSNETVAPTQTSVDAQLNASYDLRAKQAQLTTHNNSNNQIIDTICSKPLAVTSAIKVSTREKSIAIDDNLDIPSTSIDSTKLHVNRHAVEVVTSTTAQSAVRKDEQTRRKSCKKKPEVAVTVVSDPNQR